MYKSDLVPKALMQLEKYQNQVHHLIWGLVSH